AASRCEYKRRCLSCNALILAALSSSSLHNTRCCSAALALMSACTSALDRNFRTGLAMTTSYFDAARTSARRLLRYTVMYLVLGRTQTVRPLIDSRSPHCEHIMPPRMPLWPTPAALAQR